MEKKQTAVEWLLSELQTRLLTIKSEPNGIVRETMIDNFLIDTEKAKTMERENASTFGIRVTSECCSIKNGKMEVDLHKFETLLNEMYGTKNSD